MIFRLTILSLKNRMSQHPVSFQKWYAKNCMFVIVKNENRTQFSIVICHERNVFSFCNRNLILQAVRSFWGIGQCMNHLQILVILRNFTHMSLITKMAKYQINSIIICCRNECLKKYGEQYSNSHLNTKLLFYHNILLLPIIEHYLKCLTTSEAKTN